MQTRRAFLFLGLLAVSALACSLFDRLVGGATGSDDAVLLNEVLFFPSAGADAFVELKSTGRISLAGLTLTNAAGERFSLPPGLEALTPDRTLLIIFDAANRVEGDVVHADSSDFLDPESGSVELTASDGTVLDRVAWGPAQPNGVRLSRGGMVSALAPGTTIGRFPLSTAVSDRLEWVTFAPAQARPGAPNPQPGVEILLPLNGAVFDQPQVSLNWYPVAGAAKYRVQLAADRSFAALALDQTVELPPLTTDPLQPGQYFWRVQALATDGSSADFSAVTSLTVRTESPGLSAPVGQLLSVPLYAQHKDTAMLLLESSVDHGGHAWDAPHAGYSAGDPADQSNCAPAAIAMINAYFGGHLSQDRISYEIFKVRQPGPERDLNYADGFNDAETDRALIFALGDLVLPTWRPAPENADVLWTDVKESIDASRPVLAKLQIRASSHDLHAVVITGYWEADGQRLVVVNDPLSPVPYLVNVELGQASAGAAWGGYVLLPGPVSPAFDEPEITQDSDSDGVVDFDETKRFHTDPRPRGEDSDKDDVKDKQEIYASVFDQQHGYGKHYSTGGGRGRDFDGDGVAMELDEDSDDGGCFDGMEDFDRDGKYKEPETYNFEKGDDACFWGTDELYLDTTSVYDDGTHHQTIRTYVKFSLRAAEGGKLEGLAQITYTHTGQFNYPDCSGTHDIGTQFFQADLKGEFIKTPEGGTIVGFQAVPDHGEPYFIEWIVACGGVEPPNEQYDGWGWGGSSGTLQDGVYDYYLDGSLTAGVDELWQKIHMEQGGAQ